MADLPAMPPSPGPRLFAAELQVIGGALAYRYGIAAKDIDLLLLAPSPEPPRQNIDWLEDIILSSGDFKAGLRAAETILKDLILSEPITD